MTNSNDDTNRIIHPKYEFPKGTHVAYWPFRDSKTLNPKSHGLRTTTISTVYEHHKLGYLVQLLGIPGFIPLHKITLPKDSPSNDEAYMISDGHTWHLSDYNYPIKTDTQPAAGTETPEPSIQALEGPDDSQAQTNQLAHPHNVPAAITPKQNDFPTSSLHQLPSKGKYHA